MTGSRRIYTLAVHPPEVRRDSGAASAHGFEDDDMSVDAAALLRSVFEETVAAHDWFAAAHLPVLVAAADAIVRSLSNGGKVLAFGNGGSAADAQHLVTELVGRFEVERRSLAGVALTADSNVLHLDRERLRLRGRVQPAGRGARAGRRHRLRHLHRADGRRTC